MATKTLAVPSWEDIVFERRNRTYGAYRLRKLYSQRVMLGSGTSIAMIALLIFLMECGADGIEKIVPPPPKDKGGHTFTEYNKRKRETKSDTKPKPPKERKVRKDVFLVVKHNVDSVAVLDDSVEYVPELPSDFYGDGEIGDPLGTGDISEPPAVVVLKKVHDVVEIMPQYEGGHEALYKFISKHVRYPRSAKAINIEGTVYVRFVVGGDGNVRDVEVIRGIHRDCDREAARVISMLPGWKGGRQNGQAVDVRMVLPLKFELN